MYKYGIGDFPLKVYPCKYWWVRYTVACTLLTETLNKLWKPKLDELMKKHNIVTIASRGIFDPVSRALVCKVSGSDVKNEIIVHIKTQKGVTKKVVTPRDKELYEVLEAYIMDCERTHWVTCPYQYDDQSKCPFYEPDPDYKEYSLEELRTWKGYEV